MSAREPPTLMDSFAEPSSEGDDGDSSIRDHLNAGIEGLDESDLESVHERAVAYREHFGFHLIICARKIERDQRILSTDWSRMADEWLNAFVANANPIAKALQRVLGSSL